MLEILESLFTKRKSSSESYRGLVDDMARGVNPSAAKADRILLDSRKTVEELQRDVERKKNRIRLAAIVADGDAAMARSIEIEQKRLTAVNEFNRRYVEQEAELQQKVHEWKLAENAELQKVMAARDAAHFLASDPDPDVRAEMDAVQAELTEILSKRNRLNEVMNDPNYGAWDTDPANLAAMNERVSSLQARVEELSALTLQP